MQSDLSILLLDNDYDLGIDSLIEDHTFAKDASRMENVRFALQYGLFSTKMTQNSFFRMI
jgi:hypothetical protein